MFNIIENFLPDGVTIEDIVSQMQNAIKTFNEMNQRLILIERKQDAIAANLLQGKEKGNDNGNDHGNGT